MLGIPSQTPYDLNFRLLGIPVRVHPFFWLVAALLAGVGSGRTVQVALIGVACIFASILFHELGHGFMAKIFGYRPYIVLYGMGGLCASEGERQTPGQRLAVLICGPGAGFLLAGLAYLPYHAARIGAITINPYVLYALSYLCMINLIWSILNLMPVWPLDGGQITGVVLTKVNRRNGMRWTHVVSLLMAGLLAIVAYQKLGDMFLALFFVLFAMTNFQILQAMHQYARYGNVEDDDDWWKR